jgi:hypothetical protein
MAACALLGAALFWGLRAGRPAVLMYGGVAAMVVILTYGTWLYTPRFNELWDFRRLAASIERQAAGGETAMFGVRLFPLDFYLGRQVRWLGTVQEFDAYLGRADRPVAVVNGRAWRSIQGQTSPGIRVLEETTIGHQQIFIVRREVP